MCEICVKLQVENLMEIEISHWKENENKWNEKWSDKCAI